MALDRAVGAMLGLAAGDALGAAYEFGPRLTSPPEMAGGGPFGWEPGEWTDDTQMALCIARVTGAGELARRAAQHFAANPRGAAGNGSLMRTAPVALAYLGDEAAMAEAAVATSALTHGDRLAGEACVLWCTAVDRAVREGRIDGVREGIVLLEAPSRDAWHGWLDEAERVPPEAFVPNGFVVRALQAAWSAIRATPVPARMPCLHLQRALERAVSVGDDSDTVGAIAGQLLGARWGASAFPLAWRAVLHGWPGYDTADLERVAILCARGGKADPVTGWPTAGTLLPYYRRWGATGLVAGLEEDPGVRVGDALAAAADREADVVVSLCRMGAGDVEGREHHRVWL
ncbi:MAG: ADP-ribosylglycohydrolase family protein, partial [Actinomycetota bacterium]